VASLIPGKYGHGYEECRSQNFVKKRTRIRSHFSLSAAAGIYVVFTGVRLGYMSFIKGKLKTLLNFGCIGGIRILKMSLFKNFKKLKNF